MNRIMIFLFIICFASILSGQNNSITNQTGNNHVSAVSQTGSSNISTIDQVRTVYTYYPNVSNEAVLTQNGTGNISDIDQNKGTYGGNIYNNKVNVLQEGNGHNSKINQNVNDYAEAKITQKLGDLNQAIIDQISNTSIAVIYQEGSENYGKQYLWTFQSTANINQVGNANKAEQTTLTPPVKQSTFNIEQYGNSNYSKQEMEATAWGYSSALNSESAIQKGDLNNSLQYQLGNTNTSIVNVNGSSNSTKTFQEGDNHYASVNQIGDANEFESVQDGGNLNIINVEQSEGSKANIAQHGSDNIVCGLDGAEDPTLAQSLAGSTFDLLQQGSSNTVKLFQDNTSGTNIDQIGNTNLLIIEQH